MTMSTDRIALGYGKAYIAAYDAGSPAALPADTVARDGSWGGSWVDLGYTGGVQYNVSKEHRNVEVDQSTIEVFSRVVKQDVQIELTLKQASVENIKYALGFGTLATSGSSGVLTVNNNPTLDEFTLGIEGPSADDNPTSAQRIVFYRVTPTSEPEQVFSREEETVVAVRFKALLHGTNGIFQIRQYRP
jgi:hypothetical protein